MYKPSFIRAFKAYLLDNKAGCLVYTGNYAHVELPDGKFCVAHRVAYAIEHQVTVANLGHVSRTCTTKQCCLPAHLRHKKPSVKFQAKKDGDRTRMKSGVKVPLSDQELSDMRQDYLEGKDFLELAAKYSRSDGYIRYLCSNVRRADQPWPGGIGILKQGPLTREEILKRAALVKAPLSDAEITHLSQQYRGEEKDGNLGQFAENYRQNRPPPALTAPPEEATNTVNFMGSKALHTLLKSYAKDNGLKPSMAIAQIISQHMNLEVGGLVETDTGKKDHPFFMSDPTVVALLRSKVRQTNVSISQMCRHLLSHGLLQIKAAKQSEKRPMTPEEVREIRKQFLAGKKIGELGKEFCRDGLAIYYICNNLKHSDVPWPGIGLLRPGPLTLKEIKDQVARARKATNNK